MVVAAATVSGQSVVEVRVGVEASAVVVTARAAPDLEAAASSAEVVQAEAVGDAAAMVRADLDLVVVVAELLLLSAAAKRGTTAVVVMAVVVAQLVVTTLLPAAAKCTAPRWHQEPARARR